MTPKIKLDLLEWTLSHYYGGYRVMEKEMHRVIINEKDEVLFGYINQ